MTIPKKLRQRCELFKFFFEKIKNKIIWKLVSIIEVQRLTILYIVLQKKQIILTATILLKNFFCKIILVLCWVQKKLYMTFELS